MSLLLVSTRKQLDSKMAVIYYASCHQFTLEQWHILIIARTVSASLSCLACCIAFIKKFSHHLLLYLNAAAFCLSIFYALQILPTRETGGTCYHWHTFGYHSSQEGMALPVHGAGSNSRLTRWTAVEVTQKVWSKLDCGTDLQLWWHHLVMLVVAFCKLAVTKATSPLHRGSYQRGCPYANLPCVFQFINCLDIVNRIYYAAVMLSKETDPYFPLWMATAIAGPGRPLIIPFAFTRSQLIRHFRKQY